MKTKKVVFLGAKIGLDCFKLLINARNDLNIDIVGLLTNKRGTELTSLARASKNQSSIKP